MIGKFLKQRSEKFFVATKLGRSEDLYPDKYTEAGVRAATEASLQRLGVDTIDLTQLQCISIAELRKGEIFKWLRKLQQEEKSAISVRAWKRARRLSSARAGRPRQPSDHLQHLSPKPHYGAFPGGARQRHGSDCAVAVGQWIAHMQVHQGHDFRGKRSSEFQSRRSVLQCRRDLRRAAPLTKGGIGRGRCRPSCPDGLTMVQMAQRVDSRSRRGQRGHSRRECGGAGAGQRLSFGPSGVAAAIARTPRLLLPYSGRAAHSRRY